MFLHVPTCPNLICYTASIKCFRRRRAYAGTSFRHRTSLRCNCWAQGSYSSLGSLSGITWSCFLSAFRLTLLLQDKQWTVHCSVVTGF